MSIVRKPLATRLITLLIGIAFVGGYWLAGDPTTDQVVADSARSSWQAETDVLKADLPGFLETIDSSCDVDVEPQGLSAYIVAYRCLD